MHRREQVPESAPRMEAPQRIVLPICRQCGADFKALENKGKHEGCRYYRCTACGNRFKVSVISEKK